MKINQLIHQDCVEGMKALPAECIPLTVTSPPFDGLRDFGGHRFDFESIASELWRITQQGGVVCWHVQEQIKDGSETGTSSEQRLYFRDLGFRLHHTMVVATTGGYINKHARYGAALQYLFVLSKGKPRSINLIKDVPNKWAGAYKGFYMRNSDGTITFQRNVLIGKWRIRGPIWELHTGTHNTSDPEARQHSALMHEGFARDLIISFSRPGDLVFDPMAGAATTLKMAMLSHRHWLGFEIHEPYVLLGRERLAKALRTLTA